MGGGETQNGGGGWKTHNFWDRDTHTHRRTEVHIEMVSTYKFPPGQIPDGQIHCLVEGWWKIVTNIIKTITIQNIN